MKNSCLRSCSPSDYCPGGKCDHMGCYEYPQPGVRTRMFEYILIYSLAFWMVLFLTKGVEIFSTAFIHYAKYAK